MQNKLRNLRLEFGITQKQLSRKLNIPIEIIKQLESESLPVCYKHLLKLASFFQITIDSLLNTNKTNLSGSPPLRDHQELLRIYASLDEISKGKLYARAIAIAEESTQKNEQDIRGGGEYYLC